VAEPLFYSRAAIPWCAVATAIDTANCLALQQSRESNPFSERQIYVVASTAADTPPCIPSTPSSSTNSRPLALGFTHSSSSSSSWRSISIVPATQSANVAPNVSSGDEVVVSRWSILSTNQGDCVPQSTARELACYEVLQNLERELFIHWTTPAQLQQK
jgi:hypothetical protein